MIPLSVVDAFTDKAFGGNPAAVCVLGRWPSDEWLQLVGREMNLSETTFILPRDKGTERERGVPVRIFTVQEELPFAGHPTLGTAFVLRGETRAPEIALDLKVGRVPVTFEDQDGKPSFGEMTQMEPKFGTIHDRQAVASACGLPVAAFDPDLPIQTVSTGVAFVVAPLASLEIARKLQINQSTALDYLDKADGKFFYFVTRGGVLPSARLHARMLFYNGEDPATGSAAGCAAAWMTAHGVAQPDERVLIEQGVEMQRPSHIFVRAGKKDNRVINVRVGGNVVEIMRAEVFL